MCIGDIGLNLECCSTNENVTLRCTCPSFMDRVFVIKNNEIVYDNFELGEMNTYTYSFQATADDDGATFTCNNVLAANLFPSAPITLKVTGQSNVQDHMVVKVYNSFRTRAW